MEEKWKLALILGIIFLIFLTSLILILFSVRTYIWGQVESLKILVNMEEKTLQTPENQNLREKILLANQNLLKLNSFYQTKSEPSKILEKISGTLPSGIYLNTIFWQKSTSQVGLSGKALSREILLDFKKNLESREEFTDVYFPASVWLESVDIDFQATFKVK